MMQKYTIFFKYELKAIKSFRKKGLCENFFVTLPKDFY